MDAKKRILVLSREDIQLFCVGITTLLRQEATLRVDVRRNSRELPSVVPALRPDLILYFPTQIAPPLPVRTTNSLKKHTKVLLVFCPGIKWTLRNLQDFDADGAVSSGATRSELLLAINTLLIKKLKYISPLLTDMLIARAGQEPWSMLSKKEKEIASFITNGKRNIDIATELSISPKTVNTHKVRIYRKLGISNAVQLLKLWQQGQFGEGAWDQFESGRTNKVVPNVLPR